MKWPFGPSDAATADKEAAIRSLTSQMNEARNKWRELVEREREIEREREAVSKPKYEAYGIARGCEAALKGMGVVVSEFDISHPEMTDADRRSRLISRRLDALYQWEEVNRLAKDLVSDSDCLVPRFGTSGGTL